MMDEDDLPTQTNDNDNDRVGDGYGYFADEIIVEILLRLPKKSLFRTKSVCKRWYNLSSHPSFIKLYNQISLKNPMLLLQSSSSFILIDHKAGVSELSLDFIKQDRLKIRASSNGCLLLCSYDDVYYVCNPITRHFKLLPRSHQRPVTPFYPDGEPTLVALSCDFSTNTFYVVLAGYHRMFGHRPQGGKLICSVFHSETNKWRRYVSDQQHHHHGFTFTHMNRNQVVFLNACLHWMTQNYVYILVLDLNFHVWTRMLLPDQISGSGTRAYLLELDGKLSVIQISSVWMNIWVLQDYDDKGHWDMIDQVSLRCIRGMVPGIYPISQGTDYVFLAGHKQVLVYHRKTRVWKEMYSVKNHSTMPLWFSAHPFRGTIFSTQWLTG